MHAVTCRNAASELSDAPWRQMLNDQSLENPLLAEPRLSLMFFTSFGARRSSSGGERIQSCRLGHALPWLFVLPTVSPGA